MITAVTPSFEATYMSPHLNLKQLYAGQLFAHGGKKDDNILAGIHFVSNAIFKGYEVIV